MSGGGSRGNARGGEDDPMVNLEIVEEIYPVREIVQIITEGAESFLAAEYYYCAIFIVGMCILLQTVEEEYGTFWTTGAFFAGAVTSIVAGYIGMKVAVYSNGRVAL
jgi:inorganic pyrophosphatase